jgi:hypothetical protein
VRYEQHQPGLLLKQIPAPASGAMPAAIGVLSHIVIDLIFHEHDIRLSPFTDHPAWGLGIIQYPLVNFILELLYGIACWWYFGGNKKLLAAIIIFNLADLPTMFASGDMFNPLNYSCFIIFRLLPLAS